MNLRMGLVALLAVIVLAAAACGDAAPKPTPTPEATATPAASAVVGSFVLNGYNHFDKDTTTQGAQGKPCEGKGGYSDIAAGMQVTLKDGDTVLDVASFGEGTTGPVVGTGKYAVPQTCVFAFTLHVPRGHQFYTVSVGRRGDRTYTYNQITTPGTLAYTIGAD